MSLKTAMGADFRRVFLNLNELAENITYTPRGALARTIRAIVIRQRLNETEMGRGRILTNQVELYIARDATDGVISVNKGDDEVSLPEIPGGAAIRWVVIDILEVTEAFWHLLAEK